MHFLRQPVNFISTCSAIPLFSSSFATASYVSLPPFFQQLDFLQINTLASAFLALRALDLVVGVCSWVGIVGGVSTLIE